MSLYGVSFTAMDTGSPRKCGARPPLHAAMTTRISLTPPPTSASMQRLMTVLSPSLRSCLVCPILLDDPAASSRAETGVSMLSPFLDDLRHDAHGDLLRRHRADGRPHGDDDPFDVLP